MAAVSLLLACLAVSLAWPVPVALSRAGWPAAHPRLALLLWQAVALLGGLSMIGSLIAWGLATRGNDSWPGGLGPLSILALSAAAVLLAHLLFTLALTGLRMSRRRRRHLEALRLVAHESPAERNRLVVDSRLPLAYCLPSTGGSITVVTDGILRSLSAEELSAVLDHERAHLVQRHDVLVWAFSAWRTALPWLPTSKLALRAVAELIEYLADDYAATRHDPHDIARALLIVADGGHGESLDAGGRHSPGLLPRTDGREPSPIESSGSAAATSSRDADLTGRTVQRAVRLLKLAPTPSLRADLSDETGRL